MTTRLIGHRVLLSDNRVVFIGKAEGDDREVTYVGFKNEHGKETKFTLSKEATEALKSLLNDPNFGEPSYGINNDNTPIEVHFYWKEYDLDK
jgi:hypothetical protein